MRPQEEKVGPFPSPRKRKRQGRGEAKEVAASAGRDTATSPTVVTSHQTPRTQSLSGVPTLSPTRRHSAPTPHPQTQPQITAPPQPCSSPGTRESTGYIYSTHTHTHTPAETPEKASPPPASPALPCHLLKPRDGDPSSSTPVAPLQQAAAPCLHPTVKSRLLRTWRILEAGQLVGSEVKDS